MVSYQKNDVGTLGRSRLDGKRVLLRVDFSVPLLCEGPGQYEVAEDFKIRAAIPTIQHLVRNNAKVLICSQLGDPNYTTRLMYSLKAIHKRLCALLTECEIKMADGFIGEKVQRQVAQMSKGSVLVLENLNYHPGEKKCERKFARELSLLADIYVSDAFRIAHENLASTVLVPTSKKIKHSVAGLLMKKELHFLGHAAANPKKPFVAIIGGANVFQKIKVMKSLLRQVDRILVGGGTCFTFLRAAEFSVGSSSVVEDEIEEARSLLELANDKIVLPVDVSVQQSNVRSNVPLQLGEPFDDSWKGIDIGTNSINEFCMHSDMAKTIIWHGPLGERDKDARTASAGTRAIARKLASLTQAGLERKDKEVTTIVVGRSTISDVEELGLGKEVSHLSTICARALATFFNGEALPGIESLDDRRFTSGE